MLVLSRECGEIICVGDDIEIVVVRIRGDTVRLGIVAPRDVKILRKEVREANKAAETVKSRNVKKDSEMNVKKLSEHATIGDKYRPAMEIEDQAEADAYFAELVRHNMEHVPGRTREKSEAIEHENLGYFAGYYGEETRARVERLFRCSHPIFGAIAENGPPTAGEALYAGKRLTADS